MKRDGIVTEINGKNATVSVLRKEACGNCSGRYFCGEAKKVEVKAVNEIGAKPGDTVVIESSAGTLLGYTALIFLLPVLLSVILYVLLVPYNAVMGYIFAAVGFFVPYVVAFIIEKRSGASLPVISAVVSPESENPPCGDRSDGEDE